MLAHRPPLTTMQGICTMATRADITPELLRQLLRYEPETGKLFWRLRSREYFSTENRFLSWNALYAGKEALTADTGAGYRHGAVLCHLFKAHRVVGDIAYIPLTRGYETIIDVQDLPLVQDYKWLVLIDKRQQYAARTDRSTGKRIQVWMHRIIMGANPGMLVDHIDGNGLNNRRSNLRLATYAQNQYNVGVRKDSRSGIKGVRLYPNGRWQARIRVDGQCKSLGYYATAEEASKAYENASKELHGIFSRLA